MDSISYDKAEWHYEGEFPEDLDFFQAHDHTGMFLGWLIDSDMISESFHQELADQITAFRARKMTGPQVFEQACGCLDSEMLSDLGNAFTSDFYLRRGANYVGDFNLILGTKYDSSYHVEDSWENYQVITAKITERFERWQRGER
jgi:hypothetical protein